MNDYYTAGIMSIWELKDREIDVEWENDIRVLHMALQSIATVLLCMFDYVKAKYEDEKQLKWCVTFQVLLLNAKSVPTYDNAN